MDLAETRRSSPVRTGSSQPAPGWRSCSGSSGRSNASTPEPAGSPGVRPRTFAGSSPGIRFRGPGRSAGSAREATGFKRRESAQERRPNLQAVAPNARTGKLCLVRQLPCSARRLIVRDESTRNSQLPLERFEDTRRLVDGGEGAMVEGLQFFDNPLHASATTSFHHRASLRGGTHDDLPAIGRAAGAFD